jgi:2-(3-amino-3-carboxypropyl)histidine synthase
MNIEEINKKYDLELDKIIKQIRKSKAKFVLLQFPDGLKPYATFVVDLLRKKTDSEFLIWLESCYGACDTPEGIEKLRPKADLIVQFGHNELLPKF